MVATTGAQLLPNSAVKTLCDELLPQTFILTPNIPEANVILKEAGHAEIEIRDLDSLNNLARTVHKLGVQYVLIKGGHIPLTSDYKRAKTQGDKKIIASVLVGQDMMEVIEFPYQDSKNTHGTGDSLACMPSSSPFAIIQQD